MRVIIHGSWALLFKLLTENCTEQYFFGFWIDFGKKKRAAKYSLPYGWPTAGGMGLIKKVYGTGCWIGSDTKPAE